MPPPGARCWYVRGCFGGNLDDSLWLPEVFEYSVDTGGYVWLLELQDALLELTVRVAALLDLAVVEIEVLETPGAVAEHRELHKVDETGGL